MVAESIYAYGCAGVIRGYFDYRYPTSHPFGDAIDSFLDWGGSDNFLSTADRELELSSMYLPSDYNTEYVNGHLFGYLNDGKTVLWDEDGDGVFDAAGTTSQNGQLFWYTGKGWMPDEDGVFIF